MTDMYSFITGISARIDLFQNSFYFKYFLFAYTDQKILGHHGTCIDCWNIIVNCTGFFHQSSAGGLPL